MSFEYIHLWLQIRLIQNSLAILHLLLVKKKYQHLIARTLCGRNVQIIYHGFSVCFCVSVCIDLMYLCNVSHPIFVYVVSVAFLWHLEWRGMAGGLLNPFGLSQWCAGKPTLGEGKKNLIYSICQLPG